MKRTYMMTVAALAFVAATTGFAVAQSGQMGQGHGPAFDFEELDSNGDGVGDACSEAASKGTDSDGDNPAPGLFPWCGFGVTQTLAFSLIGLMMLHGVSRRRRR